MKDAALYYSVGALLYCPANNCRIAPSIIQEKFGRQYSLALCLEDTISDNHVAQAEVQLTDSLKTIYEAASTMNFYLPKIFVRVRAARQILELVKQLGAAACILSGFIIPKFSPENAKEYITAFETANQSLYDKAITKQNSDSIHTFYLMPILENPDMLHLQCRHNFLYTLKEQLAPLQDKVLNIRVGGNDLCHNFGFRRHSNESIHQIGPIAQIFSDIITVFGMDYVVSGPVWEYYNGDNWEEGLKNELKDDALCGFIGKTVIHPKQISAVNAAYQVDRRDYEDAKLILGWASENPSLVCGSSARERMNEQKTHSNWAKRILYLAEVYGVR